MSVSLQARGGGRRSTTAGQARTGAVLILPFFALLTATVVIPLGYALYLSMFEERRSGLGFGAAEQVFTGVGNYARVLSDENFVRSFIVLAGYVIIYIPVMVTGALLFALLIDSVYARAKRWFQLGLFLPHAVPGIIAAIIWAYLYTPGVSPALRGLSSLNIEINVLSETLILPAVVNISVWEWMGYNVVIFFAALQAIPREQFEAASIDGAGEIRKALSIKVPHIRSSVSVVLLFTIIGALQLFTEPMLLRTVTTAVDSNFTPNMYAFTAAFADQDNGRAAAASLLLAVLAGVLSLIVTSVTSRRLRG